MHREVAALDTLAKAKVKVPQVLDGNTDEYTDKSAELYFVMEYIPGKTLTDEITEHGRLPLDKAAAMVRDLCQTVAAAHNENVLHRDLKPDNIMVRDSKASDLVIVDYGLSYSEESAQDLTHVDEQFRNRFLSLPETNTPGGDMRDKRSDVTAICSVLYYCLTGFVPGHLEDGNGHPPHRRRGYTVRQSLQNDARCDQLELLFDRAFAVEVENRFQSCEEFLTRLDMVLNPQRFNEDPAIMADEMARLLRQHDRATVIAEYAQYAPDVPSKLQHQAASLSQGIKPPFSLTVARSMPVTNITLPKDIERLSTICIYLTVGVQAHHGRFRTILFVIGEEKRQCVLLKKMINQQEPATMVNTDPHWEKVLWFTPDQLPKDEPLLAIASQSVTSAIRELTNDILSSGTGARA
jgi:serine/threonine protein kinase